MRPSDHLRAVVISPRLPIALVLMAWSLSGCGPKFIVAPNILIQEGPQKAFAHTPPAMQTADIPLFYVTDRAVDATGPKGPQYGFKRAKGLTYGTALVELVPKPTWAELVEATTSRPPRRQYSIGLSKIEEQGMFPALTDMMKISPSVVEPTEDASEKIIEQQDALCAALGRWLDQSTEKDAYVFVHGFANSFEEAAIRMAGLWHCMGRPGVPIVYSWPGGSGGAQGYAYDRESGEFTIVHLKLLLIALAQCPKVERVHILAHSRGADVATTALRELNCEFRGASGRGAIAMLRGRDSEAAPNPPIRLTQKELKLETLILAAADMDGEVFSQRFFNENLLMCSKRIVVYFSEKDYALEVADWLFGSRNRLGQLRTSDIDPKIREALATFGRLEAIDCMVSGHSTTHDYIFADPAAVSDLILVLRDRRDIGIENGRPLESPTMGVWRLRNGYPQIIPWLPLRTFP